MNDAMTGLAEQSCCLGEAGAQQVHAAATTAIAVKKAASIAFREGFMAGLPFAGADTARRSAFMRQFEVAVD